MVADADSCTYCDMCEMVCPEFAIWLSSDENKKEKTKKEPAVKLAVKVQLTTTNFK